MTVPTWVDRAHTVLVEEQASLWYDLDKALRAAINGVWSIEAADLVGRVIRIAWLVGPTGYDAVSWPLVAGGVYEAVLQVGGIEPDLPDEQEMTRYDTLMTPHGGTAEQHRARWAATVAKIRTDQETRWIKAEAEG